MPCVDVNGIALNVERVGGEGPQLVLLHGFTGSVDAWQGIAERLTRHFSVQAIDLIGHGRSSVPLLPERYSIEHAVKDLDRLFELLEISSAVVLGYSMGGRIAVHFALTFPTRVQALIMESASPGIGDHSSRRVRVESDERLARMIESDGIEKFVDYWESIPLFASQSSLPIQVRESQRSLRLNQNPTGLANSLRGMGAGAMEPVWNRLRELRMPVLYLAGELDHKYCEIGKELTSAVTDARYVEIPGAAHTIHLERPDVYLDEVSSWCGVCGNPQRKLILNGDENDGLLRGASNS